MSVILHPSLPSNDSLCVALGTVQRVLIICAEGFVQKAFITVLAKLSVINLSTQIKDLSNLALEAVRVESVPGGLDVLALGGLAALGAGVGHVVRVAILAVHVLAQLVARALDAVPAASAGRGSLGLEFSI